jgi:hypothetical protein
MPQIGLLVEDVLQLAAEQFTLGDHLRQFVAADGFAQAGLSAERDGLHEVLDFENGLFGVPNEPEHDGIDVDGDGITGECRLGRDVGHADPLVDVAAQAVDDRNHVKDAWPAQSDEAAEA